MAGSQGSPLTGSTNAVIHSFHSTLPALSQTPFFLLCFSTKYNHLKPHLPLVCLRNGDKTKHLDEHCSHPLSVGPSVYYYCFAVSLCHVESLMSMLSMLNKEPAGDGLVANPTSSLGHNPVSIPHCTLSCHSSSAPYWAECILLCDAEQMHEVFSSSPSFFFFFTTFQH